MEQEFNKIVIETVISFIEQHNLLAQKLGLGLENNYKTYLFGSQNYGDCLTSIIKDISKFDIFLPMSSFNYYGKNYLIKFNEEFNTELFSIFLKKFLNTSYELLFYKSINKIIPINFCIQNQNWEVVRNFLSIKAYKSNGLPSKSEMKCFFENLSSYKKQPDFTDCLFKFCKNNTSFMKRIEAQEHLKKLIVHFNDKEKFDIFLPVSHNVLTIQSHDFISFYINKKTLFLNFSDTVTNKKQPVTILVNILKAIKQTAPEHTKIDNLFIEQQDEKFSELLVLVKFSEKIDYSFENYYLYLLNFFINNRFEITKKISNVSNHFFLNLKYPEKTNSIKQKTAKI